MHQQVDPYRKILGRRFVDGREREVFLLRLSSSYYLDSVVDRFYGVLVLGPSSEVYLPLRMLHGLKSEVAPAAFRRQLCTHHHFGVFLKKEARIPGT
jgi:hypothetical protein